MTRGKRYCPLCQGNYDDKHWHFNQNPERVMTDDTEKLREDIKEVLKLAQEPDAKEGTIPFEDFWTDQILAKVKQHYEKELLMAEGYMEMAKEAVRVDTLREVEAISWVETINYENPKRVMYETEWETLKCREQDVRTQRD